MTRKQALMLFMILATSQAYAGPVPGIDPHDAVGGLVGLGAVLFFMYKGFQGDKHPPAPGFIMNKREERKLTGESTASVEIEAE